jgi:hypothetical protein
VAVSWSRIERKSYREGKGGKGRRTEGREGMGNMNLTAM